MSAPLIMRHMMPRDIPLFSTYVLSPEGQDYHAWEFDVIVGDPDDPGPFYPANVRRQALYLNALKIDAVGWFFATPTLIECKPNAGLSAIGQIAGYQEWYNLIFGVKPRGMIVCQRMTRQIETLCILQNIEVRRVQPADPSTVLRATEYVRHRIERRSIIPIIRSVSA